MSIVNPISQWPVNGDGEDTFGLQDMSSVSPSGYTAGHIGQALIYNRTNNDKSVVPHNSAYNFGDGSSGSPFTLAIWVKLVDATASRLMAKGINGSNAEFLFTTSGADKLNFTLYDQISTNKIQRVSIASLTGKQGEYILLAASHDGGSSSSGQRLYVGDGVSMTRLATTDGSTGSFTAMHPLSGDLWIGSSEAFGGFLDGDGDVSYVFDYALSDGGVAEGAIVGSGSDFDFLWNGGPGREFSGVAAAGRRRRLLTGRN